MPKRNKKGHFVKSHHTSHARRSSSGAIVVVERGAPARKSKRRTHRAKHHSKRRHHKRSGGGGMNLMNLAIAGAGLAYLTGDKAPIAQVTALIDKIPGSKTFGRTATAGIACLAVDRFVKKNKWLRAAGVVGVILGASQVGAKGSDFKWLGDADVGDADDDFVGDVDGDDVSGLDVG